MYLSQCLCSSRRTLHILRNPHLTNWVREGFLIFSNVLWTTMMVLTQPYLCFVLYIYRFPMTPCCVLLSAILFAVASPSHSQGGEWVNCLYLSNNSYLYIITISSLLSSKLTMSHLPCTWYMYILCIFSNVMIHQGHLVKTERQHW